MCETHSLLGHAILQQSAVCYTASDQTKGNRQTGQHPENIHTAGKGGRQTPNSVSKKSNGSRKR